MADTKNPAPAGTGEAAPIASEAIDALADILDDPEPDTEEDGANETETKSKAAGADEGEESEDDDSTDETSDGEGKAGPRDASGRFVSPNSKVKLPDGSTTTIAELTSGHLRQSDYTRKTQELAEQRTAAEAESKRVAETYQHLQTQFSRVSSWLDQTRPQPPQQPANVDPLAHVQYEADMRTWEAARQYAADEYTKANSTYQTQQTEARNKYLRNESEALFKAIPQLRDPGKRDLFVTEAVKAFGELGLKREEIAGLTDHRMILILRDAVKYRRLAAKAPQVKTDLNGKPPVIRGSRRATPASSEQAQNRQSTDRLRQSGRFQDGVAAIAAIKNL